MSRQPAPQLHWSALRVDDLDTLLAEESELPEAMRRAGEYQ